MTSQDAADSVHAARLARSVLSMARLRFSFLHGQSGRRQLPKAPLCSEGAITRRLDYLWFQYLLDHGDELAKQHREENI